MKKRLYLVGTLCLFLAVLVSCACEHDWQSATCTEPKICSKCKITDGEPLGHTWEDATCTKVKTCSKCGMTEGKMLEHLWKDATCNEAQICTVCGVTEGKPLGHVWKDASCTVPMTCTVCGKIEGSPLGHMEGDWVVESEPTVTEYGKRIKSCNICGEITDSERYDLEKLYVDGKFLFSAEEFAIRLENKLDDMLTGMEVRTAPVSETTYGVGIVSDLKPVAAIMFTDNENLVGTDGKSNHNIAAVMTKFLTEDPEDIVDTMVGIIMTCDGSLEEYDAKYDVAQSIIEAADNNDIYEENGVRYAFMAIGDSFQFWASVLQQ